MAAFADALAQGMIAKHNAFVRKQAAIIANRLADIGPEP